MSAERERLAVVGTALRNAVEAANRRKLTVRQHRTLLAVIHATVSWTKLEDQLYLAHLARIAWGVEWAEPWQIRKTSADLRDLEAAGIIEKDAPKGRPWDERGPRYRVALPRPVMDPDPGVTDPSNAPQDQDISDPDPVESVTLGSGAPPSSSPSISAEEPTTLEELFESKLTDPEAVKAAERADHLGRLCDLYGEDGAHRRLSALRGTYRWPREVIDAASRQSATAGDQMHQHLRILARDLENGWGSIDDIEHEIRETYGARADEALAALAELTAAAA